MGCALCLSLFLCFSLSLSLWSCAIHPSKRPASPRPGLHSIRSVSMWHTPWPPTHTDNSDNTAQLLAWKEMNERPTRFFATNSHWVPSKWAKNKTEARVRVAVRLAGQKGLDTPISVLLCGMSTSMGCSIKAAQKGMGQWDE